MYSAGQCRALSGTRVWLPLRCYLTLPDSLPPENSTVRRPKEKIMMSKWQSSGIMVWIRNVFFLYIWLSNIPKICHHPELILHVCPRTPHSFNYKLSSYPGQVLEKWKWNTHAPCALEELTIWQGKRTPEPIIRGSIKPWWRYLLHAGRQADLPRRLGKVSANVIFVQSFMGVNKRSRLGQERTGKEWSPEYPQLLPRSANTFSGLLEQDKC